MRVCLSVSISVCLERVCVCVCVCVCVIEIAEPQHKHESSAIRYTISDAGHMQCRISIDLDSMETPLVPVIVCMQLHWEVTRKAQWSLVGILSWIVLLVSLVTKLNRQDKIAVVTCHLPLCCSPSPCY